MFLNGRFADEITETFSGSVCALFGFDGIIQREAILTDVCNDPLNHISCFHPNVNLL